MLKVFEGLDDSQRRAVLSPSRRILVVAPPGSGKTRVLASRCARLIAEGEGPEGILAVTFTNRAAIEMRERIEGLTGVSPQTLNVGTFHGFCLKLLRGARGGFTLLDRDGAGRLLRELGVKSPEKAASFISRAKNTRDPLDEEEARVFDLYREELRRRGALDFDDLIIEAADSIERGEIEIDLSHVMVDEFQDINPLQARLVRLLSSASLFAIGDPDQAIYAFRGASLKTFLDFEEDFPDCEVIRLMRNYRSLEVIVSSSQSVIRKNAGRIENEVSSVKGGGEISLVRCTDEAGQARFIAGEIEKEMGGLQSRTVSGSCGARFSDFAALTRTNRQAERLARALKNLSSIPFHLVGPPGPSFKEFLNHLRSVARTMPEGAAIAEFIEKERAVSGVSGEVLELFLDTAKRYGKDSVENFLEEMTLLEPSDNLDVRADRVNVMTLHMAKGLEFKAVFIAGFEEGLIPLKAADVEEERRLFYVGLTRAREKAYLLSGMKRAEFGKTVEAGVSPFAGEIPGELLNVIEAQRKPLKRRPAQKNLFD